MPQSNVWFTDERYDKIRSLSQDKKLASGLALLFQFTDQIDEDTILVINQRKGNKTLGQFVREAIEHELGKPPSASALWAEQAKFIPKPLKPITRKEELKQIGKEDAE
jgi:hypothetical protein